MHLPVYQQPVEDGAAVVDGDVASHGDLAGLGVHLHHRQVGAERVGSFALIEDHLRRQPRLHAGRQRLGTGGGGGQLTPGEAGVGYAGYPDSAVSEHGDVFRAGLDEVGDDALRLLQHLGSGSQHGTATQLQGAGPAGALTPRYPCRVSLHHPYVGVGDVQPLGDDLGEGGLVALAVGRGAAGNGDRSVLVYLGRAPLLGSHRGGDLHVGADPDAELHPCAGLTSGGLLGAQLLVAGDAQRPVEGGRVVAAVVMSAGGGGEGEPIGRDEVAAPQLGGIHAQLCRQQVHRPLQQGGCLRTTGAAVSVGGGGVGGHAHHVELHLR